MAGSPMAGSPVTADETATWLTVTANKAHTLECILTPHREGRRPEAIWS